MKIFFVYFPPETLNQCHIIRLSACSSPLLFHKRSSSRTLPMPSDSYTTNKSESRCPPQTIYSQDRLHVATAVGEGSRRHSATDRAADRVHRRIEQPAAFSDRSSSWSGSSTDQAAGGVRVHRRIKQPTAFGDGVRWWGALGGGRAGFAQILCR
jgi:hypothetical protein